MWPKVPESKASFLFEIFSADEKNNRFYKIPLSLLLLGKVWPHCLKWLMSPKSTRKQLEIAPFLFEIFLADEENNRFYKVPLSLLLSKISIGIFSKKKKKKKGELFPYLKSHWLFPRKETIVVPLGVTQVHILYYDICYPKELICFLICMGP